MIKSIYRPVRYLLILSVLAGCGSNTTIAAISTATSTPAPTPTNTPVAIDPSLATACNIPTDQQPDWIQSGSLAIKASWYQIAYPLYRIPDGTDPQKPLQLIGSSSKPSNLETDVQINPWGPPEPDFYDANIYVSICNPSKVNLQQQLSKMLQVTLSGSVPDTTTYDVTGGCPIWLQMPGKIVANGLGCGGDIPHDYEAYVKFSANDPVGTTKPIENVSEANLLDTNQVTVLIAIQIPQYGKVSFTVDLTGSNGNMVQAPQTLTELLLPANQLRVWNGQSCMSPALLAQIPNPPAGAWTRYVCSPHE